jgi:hypothetical protein
VINEKYRFVCDKYRRIILSVYLKKSEGVFKIGMDKPEPNLKIFQDYTYRRLDDLK